MSENWAVALACLGISVVLSLIGFLTNYALSRTTRNIETAINGVGARIAGAEVEIGAAVSKVNNLGERVAGLEATVRELPKNSDVTALREDLHSVNNSLGRLEGKMEGSQKQIEQMYQVVLTGAKQ